MRISELSTRSEAAATAIKYYVREGLLPDGTRTGRTTTVYDEDHLARIRLIRALTHVGGLPVSRVREVLAAVDDPATPIQHVLGVTQQATAGDLEEPSPEAAERVDALLAARGWQVHPGNPGRRMVAAALDAADGTGHIFTDETLRGYAAASEQVATADLDAVARTGTRAAAAESVVLGTALGDRVLAGLRRIAQEAETQRRLPGPGCGAGSDGPSADPVDPAVGPRDR